MNHLLRTDLLADSASGAFLQIYKNQTILLFSVYGSFPARFHAKPAVYTAFTDILLETFFYNGSNGSAAARVFLLRRMTLCNTRRVARITPYAPFFIKCYLHTL
jgi:hypothetical protein